MIQQRNNSITLEEQVTQTKQNIVDGNDTYPIDIIETKQVYYALPSTVETVENHIPKELKIFLVDTRHVSNESSWAYYRTCTNDKFILEAERQGHIYTLQKFQELYNENEISVQGKYMRFIEE